MDIKYNIKKKNIILKYYNMSEKQTQLISKFNTVILALINHIVETHGDMTTKTVQYIITNVINLTPNEPISFFLLNIYKNDDYRNNILLQNDSFFINNDMNDLTQGDTNKMAKLFEFKQLWTVSSEDTKLFVKKTMMVLVKICQKYILLL
jgi:hypothetical protein